MIDAQAAGSETQAYRFEQEHIRLLSKHQLLYIDAADQLVTLVTAALNGPSGVRSCRLPPAPFRTFVILLLAAPEIASYAMLFAAISCSDECLEALLSSGSLGVPLFQALVQEARAQLAPLREEELKRQLVPVRHALGRVNQTLIQKRFGWKIDNKYSAGYLLCEVAQA